MRRVTGRWKERGIYPAATVGSSGVWGGSKAPQRIYAPADLSPLSGVRMSLIRRCHSTKTLLDASSDFANDANRSQKPVTGYDWLCVFA
jgi:hypothetical protein